VRVAVGSKNRVKIEAVRRIFSRIYGQDKVEVLGVEVDSRIPIQPLGDETIDGAVNRANEAIVKGDANLGVGIEAGLFKFPRTITGYVDIQWCAILDREGRLTVGCNSGFEYPPKVVSKVLGENREVGEVMDELTGIKDLGESVGAIGVLSKGLLDRVSLSEQAVLMAMIPRLNLDFYFESK